MIHGDSLMKIIRLRIKNEKQLNNWLGLWVTSDTYSLFFTYIENYVAKGYPLTYKA